MVNFRNYQFELQDWKINTVVAGEGPPILFLHGIGGEERIKVIGNTKNPVPITLTFFRYPEPKNWLCMRKRGVGYSYCLWWIIPVYLSHQIFGRCCILAAPATPSLPCLPPPSPLLRSDGSGLPARTPASIHTDWLHWQWEHQQVAYRPAPVCQASRHCGRPLTVTLRDVSAATRSRLGQRHTD